MTFDGAGIRTSQFALWFQAATRNIIGNEIIGCTFKSWGGAGEDSYAAALMIHKEYNDNPFRAIGTLIQGCTFDNNRLYSIETISAQDTIIENNEIKNQRCGRGPDRAVITAGIHMITDDLFSVPNSPGHLIQDNYIHDFLPFESCPLDFGDSYTVWAGLWADVHVVSSQFLRNRIHNIAQGNTSNFHNSYGAFIEDYCSNWIVRENVIHDVGTAGFRNGSAATGNPSDNQYLHNVVYQCRFGIQVPRGPRLTLKNNIFFDNSEAQIYFDEIATRQGPHSINHNDYHDMATQNKVGRWGSWEVLNLIAWQLASGGDLNSLNTDPLFVSTTPGSEDFRLQELSPARGSGENGVDMGAYPFSH